jgi:diketogulonate reductase-like aldo/keto reductase
LKLGYGTIWFNQKWPLDNGNYKLPLSDEIFSFLDGLFILNNDFVTMIDTASEYKNEHIIGNYFNKNKDNIKKSFICTKFGKILNDEFDFSCETIKLQFSESLKYLPRIDLLYIHMVYKSPIEKCINFFTNENIKVFIQNLKKNKKIKYFGASISNPNTLLELFKINLINHIDFLQIPSWFLNEDSCYNIIKKYSILCIKIVVNSPIRYSNNNFKETYIKLFKNQIIDYVLTGTRNNLKSTFNYILEYKNTNLSI